MDVFELQWQTGPENIKCILVPTLSKSLLFKLFFHLFVSDFIKQDQVVILSLSRLPIKSVRERSKQNSSNFWKICQKWVIICQGNFLLWSRSYCVESAWMWLHRKEFVKPSAHHLSLNSFYQSEGMWRPLVLRQHAGNWAVETSWSNFNPFFLYYLFGGLISSSHWPQVTPQASEDSGMIGHI